MAGRRVSHRCSQCGYYLPVGLEQCKAVEAQLDREEWPHKVVQSIVMAVRRALIRCGVCGWRCEIVAGKDDRRCEFWWRDE